MTWILFLMIGCILVGGCLSFFNYKSNKQHNISPNYQNCFIIFCIGAVFFFAVWSSICFFLTAMPQSVIARTVERTDTYPLEEMGENNYLRTVYTNLDSNTPKKALLFKCNGITQTIPLENITICFDENESRYETHNARFSNKVLDSLFLEMEAPDKILFISGKEVTGDYTITEENLKEE